MIATTRTMAKMAAWEREIERRDAEKNQRERERAPRSRKR
jgi:hypothetical protein